MNGLNLRNITNAMIGSTQVRALYYGNILIWGEQIIIKTPYRLFLSEPNLINIENSLDLTSEKPVGPQNIEIDLQTETELYIVYPTSWESIDENDLIISPIIKDINNYSMGILLIKTITVNNVELRIGKVKLGQGNYTIEFS